MASKDPNTGGTGALGLHPGQVLNAAGALDALVDEFSEKNLGTTFEMTLDAGNGSVNAAIQNFSSSWALGLNSLLTGQKDRADALRNAVRDVLDVDVDGAYAANSGLPDLTP